MPKIEMQFEDGEILVGEYDKIREDGTATVTLKTTKKNNFMGLGSVVDEIGDENVVITYLDKK